ncbi:hypothetical protein Tco_1520479, partial [Tanacetum coccineum]
VPSNDDDIESNPIEMGNDDSAATFIKENAHPNGNTNSINQSVKSEGETIHLLNNEEEIDQTDLIDYDDVVEPVEAMNNEMEDLNRNQTWEITDLLKEEDPLDVNESIKQNTSLIEKLKCTKLDLLRRGFLKEKG